MCVDINLYICVSKGFCVRKCTIIDLRILYVHIDTDIVVISWNSFNDSNGSAHLRNPLFIW